MFHKMTHNNLFKIVANILTTNVILPVGHRPKKNRPRRVASRRENSADFLSGNGFRQIRGRAHRHQTGCEPA